MTTIANSEREQTRQSASTAGPLAQPSTLFDKSSLQADAGGDLSRRIRYWWPVAILIALAGIIALGTLKRYGDGVRRPADELAPGAVDGRDAPPADPALSP